MINTVHPQSEQWIDTIEGGDGYNKINSLQFQSIIDHMTGYLFFTALLRHIQPGQSVLEAGCGWATASFALARKGIKVTAIDISEKLIADLQELQEQLGDEYIPNLELLAGDIFQLCKIDKIFDVVFSDGTYEHFLEFSDRQKILKNAFEALSSNGKFIVAVPNLHNPFFTSVVDCRMPSMCTFTIKSLSTELEKEGFRVIETGFTFVNPGFEQWVKHSWMIPIIHFANIVFRFLPHALKAVFAAHLFCVAQKIED